MLRFIQLVPRAIALLLLVTASTWAEGTKRLSAVPAPDPSLPIQSWTPVQQYTAARETYGFRVRYGMLVWADELGPKLSQLGRVQVAQNCFNNIEAKPWASMLWAVCAPDVAAIDLKKVESELIAEGISPEDRKGVLVEAAEAIDNAKKIGVAVTTAAASDAALAEIQKLATSARTEWDTYASSHASELERLATLQSAARAGTPTDVAACLAQTQPPFTKLVRATKLPWESSGDTLLFYVGFLQTTLDGYLTTLSFGACAIGLEGGEAMYAAAGNGEAGSAKRGPRSYAISKYFAPSYNPTFADGALSLDKLRRQFRGDVNVMPKAQTSAVAGIGGATISKITKAGSKTTLAFAANSVEECLEWKETNRVQIVTGTNVTYEKQCLKRGKVANQPGEVVIATPFAGGLTKGDHVITVGGFPAVAWKGKKLTAACGVALK